MALAQHGHLSPIQAYVRHVRAPGDRAYAAVDAAQDTELAFAARDRFGLELLTLFDGELAPHLDHVAPHLIAIDPAPAFLELWAEHLGRSAGILLLCEAPAEVIREHLRRIFLVTDEEQEAFFFRYYDPRVVRVYLPTCTAAEARELFGPIRRILVESDRPGVMLSCGPGRTGVQIIERTLETRDASAPAGGGPR